MTDPRRWLDDGSEASPALRTLLASAKRGDDPGAPRIEALAARLAPLMVPPPTPGAPPGGPPGGPDVPPASVAGSSGGTVAGAGGATVAVKLGAVLVVLGAIGGGAWYVHGSRDGLRDRGAVPSAVVVAPQAPSVTAGAPPVPEPASPPVTPREPPAKPGPSPITGGKPAHAGGASTRVRASDDHEAEGKLVVDAEAALVREDAVAALALARTHGARFPAGAHAEERDRIAIEAMVRLGNREQARVAGERFFARYPRSIYRARLEGLLR